MTQEELLQALASEIECSTGCTDPGSVCLAAAAAAHALEKPAEEIQVLVSPNIYKNGVSVGIPGTGRVGLELAAALGVLLDRPQRGLAILEEVTDEMVCRAEETVAAGRVTVKYGETPDPLYVRAVVRAGEDEAQAVIMYDYSNVVELSRNGRVLLCRQGGAGGPLPCPFQGHTVEELYRLSCSMEPEAFDFLLEGAQRNKQAALRDLEDPTRRLGRTIQACTAIQDKGPLAVCGAVRAYTAAAGEARMGGMNVTITAITGSGNHGITNFVGVLTAAEELEATREQTAVALAISSMITIYIKGYIKRMTAFCGCGVAAATGMAAAVTYLLGGGHEQSVQAMQTVIGTIGGMFCDGAKSSCAYKLSTAAAMAVQAAYLAMAGCHVPAGEGIIGRTIEETFANIGRLNDPGMLETDRVMVSIIAQRRAKG